MGNPSHTSEAATGGVPEAVSGLAMGYYSSVCQQQPCRGHTTDTVEAAAHPSRAQV
jgi:hypothetical protein